jgi:hypothetical protein
MTHPRKVTDAEMRRVVDVFRAAGNEIPVRILEILGRYVGSSRKPVPLAD